LYDAASIAVKSDTAMLRIEQKYSILLGNFEELERDLLAFSLAATLYRGTVRERLTDAKTLLNRRVANLLSSARAYVDQVPQDIAAAVREAEDVRAAFKASLSRSYDSELGFRVCEALRNVAQHTGLPVHGVAYGWTKNPDDPAAPILHGANIHLETSQLAEEGSFKAAVLKELAAGGERHDLKLSIRKYIGCLGACHLELRALLDSESRWAEAVIAEIVGKVDGCEDAKPGGTVWLATSNEAGWNWGHSVRPTARAERDKLVARTPDVASLDRFHISSE
jgi:hypothetical protein